MSPLSRIILSALFFAWPAVVHGQPQDDILAKIDIEQHLDALLPLDAEFFNEAGDTVPLGSFFGEKPIILALVYYNCPMLCGLVLNGLLGSLSDVAFNAGEEFQVVVVSFDPTETAELARSNKAVFLEKYGRPGAESGVHFLTGTEEAIARLTEAVGFRFVWVEEANEFAHASAVTLVTPEGRISRYFFGIEYPSREMRLALVQASQNKIGNPVDRLLLFCYHYDPVTGKYGLLIHRVVNTAAVITVLIIGGVLTVLFRRERKRPV